MVVTKRVLKEFRDLEQNPVQDITLRLVSPDNYRHLIGTIEGPDDSPYEGGRFDIDI